MCLMVLDHVRDFATSPAFSPTSPSQASASLFFTRWITHFCAPVFVLLAGVGVGLMARTGRPRAQLARFLLSRGLWLVILEITWVRFGWHFDLDYRSTTGQVIWALGWSMVLLAPLVLLLPSSLIGALGLVLVVGHDAFDLVTPDRLGAAAWLWRVLHAGGSIQLDAGHGLHIAYPIVPWIGVMGLGYLLGERWAALGRRRLLAIGSVAVIAFVVLRAINGYGDPHPREPQQGALRTLFAYLDCEKYPPSLDYLLMTTGPSLLLLGALRGRALDGALARGLTALGRAPLFFYLLHLPLVHLLTFPLRAARHLPLAAGPFRHGLDEPLVVVYGLWLLAVALLWWPTGRWAALKDTRRDWWLSYL